MKDKYSDLHGKIVVTLQRLDTCEGIIINNKINSLVNEMPNVRNVNSFLHSAEETVRKCRLGLDRQGQSQDTILSQMKSTLKNVLIPVFIDAAARQENQMQQISSMV